MSAPLRMGRINFLNVLPIYYPLEAGIIPHNFELVSAPPALLNEMMAQGALHASSCSCIEYARRSERYYLIEDLSIGSAGPVMSVLLLSQVPVVQLENREILISGESHTSVALLRLLLQDYYGISARLRTGSVSNALNRGERPTAFLAIGDEALRLRAHADYPSCVDLAEAWRQWTGLPFIFGLWVADAATVEAGRFTENPGRILRRGRDWGLAHMDVILDLTRYGCPLSREELHIYYEKGLFFTLRDEQLEGLKFFYKKLAAAGLIPKVPSLRFLP